MTSTHVWVHVHIYICVPSSASLDSAPLNKWPQLCLVLRGLWC